jgi:hypothetical protein
VVRGPNGPHTNIDALADWAIGRWEEGGVDTLNLWLRIARLVFAAGFAYGLIPFHRHRLGLTCLIPHGFS